MSSVDSHDVDGLSTADLEVGDVVLVDRGVTETGGWTFATVVDRSAHGPLLSGPGLETATLARALTIESVTRYDTVVGRDETGAVHLLDRSPHGFDVLDVVDEPGVVAHREHLADNLDDWIQFVAARRGWVSIPSRFRALLEGGEER